MNHSAYIPGAPCDKSKCCKPLPHYSLPVTDDEFLMRNIQFTEEKGVDIPDQYLTSAYVYPGNLTRDVAMSMGKDEYEDWRRQERTRRGNVCPSAKWWQDLNSGRRYYRGISDDLDQTMNERNNFASGWFNAKCVNKETMAGSSVPYRNPYVENISCGNDPYTNRKFYNPDVSGQQRIPMNNLGSKHYYYSIYDLRKWPDPFCRCTGSGVPCAGKNAGKCFNCNKRYPDKYY